MKNSIAALLLSLFATPPAVADGFFTGAYVGQASTDAYGLSFSDTYYSVTAAYQVMKHAAAEGQHDNIGGAESQIDDYGAVGFLPLNENPWSLVPKRDFADPGVDTAAYQFWPNRWAGKSRESSAFSLKMPRRHLQAAL